MASNDTSQRSVADNTLSTIGSQKLSGLSPIEHPVVSSQPPADDLPKSLEVTTTADFGFLPIPPQCRYNPDQTQDLPHWKTAIFALASTFTAMNLYYCQPILVQLAEDFHVDYIEVSRIPTLLQAGYAVGLVFLSPLGDLIRRRQLLLVLMFTSGSLSVGLALTKSIVGFEILSFFVAISSVTPQVLMPLTADLARPSRRATSIAIVISGLLMGVLLARVLGGVIAQFSSFRNIYWMGVGGQFLLLLAIYLVCPDVPVKNPDLTYLQILLTMLKFAVTEPLLLQGALIFFAGSAIFAGFWVTMTFLLAGAPYHYSTLEIGIFGLVGMFGISTAPFVGRLVDGFVPWMATFVSLVLVLLSQVIQTAAGKISIGAVIVATLVLDIGAQACQVSVTAAVFGIQPEARARLNAVLVFFLFMGQVMGTAVGTELLVNRSYTFSSAVRVSFCVFQFVVLLARGPHVPRKTWFGWAGGMEFRKQSLEKKSVSFVDEKGAAIKTDSPA